MTDYATALTGIRQNVADLVADLDVWVDRAVDAPDPRARRYANEAMDAIDAAIRGLHEVRGLLIAEMGQCDDETAARVDRMLGKYGG